MYGKIVETGVDVIINRVLVAYSNADEFAICRIKENIKDLVLILSSYNINFNSTEHQLTSWLQQIFSQ